MILEKISVNVEFNTIESTTDNLVTASSTFCREILFVAHHSIHHLAMIKLILQHMNYDQIDINNLGLAPSTILYKESNNIWFILLMSLYCSSNDSNHLLTGTFNY